MEPVSGLNELFLEVDGQRYAASAPEWGDATVETVDRPGSGDVIEESEQEGRVTVGLVPGRLEKLSLPADAVLRRRSGRPVLGLRLDKFSPELSVVVGKPVTVH
jgi:hypothetical protein